MLADYLEAYMEKHFPLEMEELHGIPPTPGLPIHIIDATLNPMLDKIRSEIDKTLLENGYRNNYETNYFTAKEDNIICHGTCRINVDDLTLDETIKLIIKLYEKHFKYDIGEYDYFTFMKYLPDIGKKDEVSTVILFNFNGFHVSDDTIANLIHHFYEGFSDKSKTPKYYIGWQAGASDLFEHTTYPPLSEIGEWKKHG